MNIETSNSNNNGTAHNYDPSLIRPYIATLAEEAQSDFEAGVADEVQTDALYAACGASTKEEMADALRQAQQPA